MQLATDALSGILRMVRLRACIYFIRSLPEGWGMKSALVPQAPLHMVLSGTCLLSHGDSSLWLRAGDAVLFPAGEAHVLVDRPGVQPQSGGEFLTRLKHTAEPHGEAVAVRLLCGHFEWDRSFDHPLFRELPSRMLVRGLFRGPCADAFAALVSRMAEEVARGQSGATAIVDRMGEVLFISVLRKWLEDEAPGRGMLAALRDPRLVRALHRIHENGEERIDVGELARIAGMSRSAFITGFREKTGMPPGRYLLEWRMLKARHLLQAGQTLAEIAERVGYGSEAAFVRAFKRRFGETPGRFRRGT